MIIVCTVCCVSPSSYLCSVLWNILHSLLTFLFNNDMIQGKHHSVAGGEVVDVQAAG